MLASLDPLASYGAVHEPQVFGVPDCVGEHADLCRLSQSGTFAQSAVQASLLPPAAPSKPGTHAPHVKAVL